jgi:hypothetical protein
MEIDPHIFEQQQAAQPQTVQPQPAPETWRFDVLSNGMVAVTIHSVTGSHVSFLNAAAAADVIGPNIIAAGRQAKSGLVLPSNVILSRHNGHGPTEVPPSA